MRRVELGPAARLRGAQGLQLAAFAALLALVGTGVGRADESKLTAIPWEVREALGRAARAYERPLSGARWSEVYRLTGTDHPVFQLRGTNGRGNKIEIEVTCAGRVIEVEEHGIALGEVPRAVTRALQARLPHFKPTQAKAVYQGEMARPVCYGFEGKDADGRTFLNR